VNAKARMTPTIIDVLDDMNLLEPHFRGPTWRPWRAVLRGIFSLSLLDAAELGLLQEFTDRKTLRPSLMRRSDVAPPSRTRPNGSLCHHEVDEGWAPVGRRDDRKTSC
jgi:hypothetical protein